MLDVGLRLGPPVELDHGEWYDLTRPAVQRVILDLVRWGLLWLVWFALPCTVNSVARLVRDGDDPARVRFGPLLSFVWRLILYAERHGVYTVVENPRHS